MSTLYLVKVLMTFLVILALFTLAAAAYLSAAERSLMIFDDDQLTDEPITREEADNV